MSSLKNISIIAAAFVSASLFLAPLCGLLFGCGCSWLWTTAAAHCNVHDAAPPNCPWCSHGYVGYALPYCGFLLMQTAAGLLTWRHTQNLTWSIAATVASMAPVGLLLAGITLALTR